MMDRLRISVESGRIQIRAPHDPLVGPGHTVDVEGGRTVYVDGPVTISSDGPVELEIDRHDPDDSDG